MTCNSGLNELEACEFAPATIASVWLVANINAAKYVFLLRSASKLISPLSLKR